MDSNVSLAPGVGLEPTTFGLTARRSAELSYPGKGVVGDWDGHRPVGAIVDRSTNAKHLLSWHSVVCEEDGHV